MGKKYHYEAPFQLQLVIILATRDTSTVEYLYTPWTRELLHIYCCIGTSLIDDTLLLLLVNATICSPSIHCKIIN